jgi:hypothetical protein
MVVSNFLFCVVWFSSYTTIFFPVHCSVLISNYRELAWRQLLLDDQTVQAAAMWNRGARICLVNVSL